MKFRESRYYTPKSAETPEVKKPLDPEKEQATPALIDFFLKREGEEAYGSDPDLVAVHAFSGLDADAFNTKVNWNPVVPTIIRNGEQPPRLFLSYTGDFDAPQELNIDQKYVDAAKSIFNEKESEYVS